jgi:CHAT domain-containing protein/Tfp pilus assembly protein PilF
MKFAIIAYFLRRVISVMGYHPRCTYKRTIVSSTLAFILCTLFAYSAHANGGGHVSVRTGDSRTDKAIALRDSGDFVNAIKMFEQAVIRYEHTGNELKAAQARINIGATYTLVGRYVEALNALEAAENTLAEQMHRRQPEVVLTLAKLLNNKGYAYRMLGDNYRALDSFKKALHIAKSFNDYKTEGSVLNNTGLVLMDANDYRAAYRLFNDALMAQERARDLNGAAQTYASLGVFHSRLGQLDKALANYQRALKNYRNTGDFYRMTRVLRNIGSTHFHLGSVDQALTYYQQALAVCEEINDLDTKWRTLSNLSSLYLKQDKKMVATLLGKKSVNTIQRIRQNISSLEPQLQESFLEEKRIVYEFLTDLLIEQGRLFEAQTVLAMLKEEEYFDFIRRSRDWERDDTEIRYSGIERPFAQRYEEIAPQLVNLGNAYAVLVGKKRRGDALSMYEQRRLEALRSDLEVAERALSGWFEDMSSSLSSAKHEDLSNILRTFDDEKAHVQQLLENLGQGSVLIHYLPTKDKLHILVTTPMVSVHREVHVERKRLNKLIIALREKLKLSGNVRGWSDTNSDSSSVESTESVRQIAQQLYRWLIAPIDDDLRQANAQMLMLYLYGEMRYLPFAALYDGVQWLPEKYASAIYTAAGRHLETAPQAAWKVAGLGVSEQHRDFAPLPAVAMELEGIVKQGENDPEGIIPGEIYLNADFTENRLFDVLERGFPVVHIASHFHLQVGTDEDSFLLLGNGGQLSLRAIADKKLRFGDLDLLTLSACNTGMGIEGTGTEVEGLATLANKRGARSVLATLWQVSDQSTADFMRAIYRIRTTDPRNKAKALQAVQQSFIEAAEEGSDYPAYYSQPFHWAPFILMGNWL